MSNDRYERIRVARERGPPHGPCPATKPEPHGTEVRGPAQVSLAWCGGATTVGEEGCYSIGAAEAAANAHLIAACDPDTSRALLDERDALAAEVERLAEALRELEEREQRDEALLREALYALEYASDMTKPEGLQGCGCPICTNITALRERLGEGAEP